MKKYFSLMLLFAVAASFAFASCSQDVPPAPPADIQEEKADDVKKDVTGEVKTEVKADDKAATK